MHAERRTDFRDARDLLDRDASGPPRVTKLFTNGHGRTPLSLVPRSPRASRSSAGRTILPRMPTITRALTVVFATLVPTSALGPLQPPVQNETHARPEPVVDNGEFMDMFLKSTYTE